MPDKPFSDFVDYVHNHISELTYEITTAMAATWNEDFTLPEVALNQIVQLSLHSCVSVLRQYNNWMTEQPERRD